MATIATKTKSVLPAKLETELTGMDAGIVKDIPAKTALTLNGKATTPQQVDAQIKSYLATFQAADEAKRQYQTALEARRNIQLEARDLFLQLKKFVTAFFGARNPILADFGLKPAKAVVRSGKTNVVAKAKGDITRAARGTKTKKQKQAIQPNHPTPAVGIGSDGTVRVTPPPTVSPGASAGTADGGSQGSTPQGSNGAVGGASSAQPADGGTPASGNGAAK